MRMFDAVATRMILRTALTWLFAVNARLCMAPQQSCTSRPYFYMVLHSHSLYFWGHIHSSLIPALRKVTALNYLKNMQLVPKSDQFSLSFGQIGNATPQNF